MRSFKTSIVLGSLAFALAACSGGGSGSGSGAITGLEPPASLEVITVDEAAGLPAGMVAPPAVDPTYPVDSDYNTDVARNHVWDPAVQPIATINEILCYMGQTASSQMVNAGPYNAQVDEAKCRAGEDSSNSSSGQSSGSHGVEPNIWVVDSTRGDNSSAQNVHIWLPDDKDGAPGTIYVDMVIADDADQANPFGEFLLNFAGTPDVGGDLNAPTMWGTLATTDPASGQSGFTFYQSEGDINVVPPEGRGAQIVAVTVDMSSDQVAGQARLAIARRYNDPMGGDTGIIQEEYLLDIDGSEVLRQLGSAEPQCYSRTQFHYNTWRYNLYLADGVDAGQRVTLESGFPINKDGYFGWLGYWGVWMPEAAGLQNGDIVQRAEFGSATVADYTIVQAPGKLIKFTRNTLALDDGDGQTFEYWQFSGGSPARYQVELMDGLFFKVALWNDMTQVYDTLGAPEQIDTAACGFLNMFSQTLGGSVGYVHGDAFLTYFAQEFVNGSSTLFNLAVAGDVALYGYVQCLGSSLTGANAEVGDIYLADSFDVGAPHVFQFSESSLTLYYDVNGDGSLLTQVGLADGEAPLTGPYVWGMRSGPMVTDPSGLGSPWEIWNQAVFYQYETGANAWNQYTTAMDANGDFVVFDPPLQLTYQHATANDANADASYDGRTFQLGYGGPGNLWGIPQSGIDFDGDGNFDRWFPACSLKDGTLVSGGGVNYVIRALESELTLLAVPGGCAALDVASAALLTLPTADDFTVPDIGTKPVVTDPPAVIEGVVQ